MKLTLLQIILIFALLIDIRVYGQNDTVPPVSPVLQLVTVNQVTGNEEISWSPSPSPDVSGYVVYLFRNNEGYPIDTIHNPNATIYIRPGQGSSYFSESFVVAAIDSSENISPLSNELSTILAEPKIDTCNKRIEIKWNSYPSWPKQVLSYTVLYSEGGGSFAEAGVLTADKTGLVINDFITNEDYCFIIKANLEGGDMSVSNKSCLFTKMQRPPGWINADYATIQHDNSLSLSFTMDPASEIKILHIERRTGFSGIFSEIAQVTPLSGQSRFIDSKADITRVNFYRASAKNNCGVPVTFSNTASNIVLSLDRTADNNDIKLRWNHYRQWNGIVSTCKLEVNTGKGWEELKSVEPGDSTLSLSYSDLMYNVTGNNVCFIIKVTEGSNPYGIIGESSSSQACTPATERITVPNVFTPDNNSVNDNFRPVLSFSATSYELIITNLQRNVLFRTTSQSEEWDGMESGRVLPEGIYLWFLKVKAPSGRSITKSGTVTLKFNR